MPAWAIFIYGTAIATILIAVALGERDRSNQIILTLLAFLTLILTAALIITVARESAPQTSFLFYRICWCQA